MKIAIIGSGIAGLTCAHYLNKQHDIQLFEANDYLGGHTATVDVEVDSGQYAIDTGFIVFNDRTYPNYERLLNEIGVGRQPSQMSFSVRNDANGLEYNGHSLSSLFAQKRNIVNVRFYRFLAEIMRFNRLARDAYTAKDSASSSSLNTLGDFLNQHGFSDYFCQNYILPMGAAIWSSTLSDMRGFPLAFFLRFFQNHGLLDVTNRPQWYVVPGGSREYVKKLTPAFADKIHLNTPVKQVRRDQNAVYITTDKGEDMFDQVVFACHSDQALKMLADPSDAERDVLGAIPYQDNEVVLHTDTALLPKRQGAWASWNYHLPLSEEIDTDPAALTYNMNILQSIQSPETFCVTLNQTDRIEPSKILRRFVYAHPVFNTESVAAQQKRHQINGKQQSWFCGAYWYNGFHEDGVKSALDVVEGINS